MEEDLTTRYVWLCMIALADKEGIVDITREALARLLNIEFSLLEKSLEILLAPDPKSRSDKEEGRRLLPLTSVNTGKNWGWILVNYAEYDAMRCEEERREYMRFYMRNKRKNKENFEMLTSVKNCKKNLTLPHEGEVVINNKNTLKREKFQKPTIDEIRDYCRERKNEIDPEAFFNFYESKGWVIGKSPMKNWKAAIRTWETNSKDSKKDGGQSVWDVKL